MTVTELRETLQKLEAEGKGAMRAAYMSRCHDEPVIVEAETLTAFAVGDDMVNPGFAAGTPIVLIE